MGEDTGPIFFRLSTWELGLLVFIVIIGSTALGVFLGHRVRHLSDRLKEPLGILQAALLGVVGLILAFGLSLAIRLSDHVPGSAEASDAAAREGQIQRERWSLAGQALERAPTASAPRLYVETLNEMIDAESVRVAALGNRVPTAVLLLQVLGSALAVGLLGAYVAIIGRGVPAVFLASALVAFLLLVTADLDRPTRGMIRIPDAVLIDQLESMTEPPAARAPR
jgi:Flp pilus assembly protein TadB